MRVAFSVGCHYKGYWCLLKHSILPGELLMEWSDIVRLIQSGDSVSTKFFKQIDDPSVLAQVVTAFANTIGGQVVIGIDRANLHFLGSNLLESELALILSEIKPRVFTRVAVVEKGDRVIHVIEVEMGNQRPYSYQNTIYTLDETRPWGFKLVEEALPSGVKSSVATASVNSDVGSDLDSDAGSADSLESTHVALTESARVVSDTIPGFDMNQVGNSRLSWRQIEVINYLKSNPVIQNKTYRALYGVSHKTAHLELTDLVTRGEIIQRGSGRSTHYVGSPS